MALSRLTLVLVAALLACSGSPARQAARDATTVHSWTAAARMIVEARAADRVTAAYASSSLEVAQRELEQAGESLESQAAGAQGAAHAAGAATAAHAASAHLAAARAALERDDPGAAAAAARLLAGDESTLGRLERRLKASAR